MKKLFGLLLVLLAAGCSTAIVRPYVGEQVAWPTAPGSIVITRYGLPVFTTLPSSPYRVLAELRLESPFYATPEPGQMPVLVAKAKELGADAIALVDGQTFFANAAPTSRSGSPTTTRSAATTVNKFNPDSFKPNIAVVAIQWVGEPPEGLTRYSKTTPPPAPEKETEPKANFGPSTAPNIIGKAPNVPTAVPEAPEPTQKTVETLLAPAPETAPTNATPAAPKVEEPKPAPAPAQ